MSKHLKLVGLTDDKSPAQLLGTAIGLTWMLDEEALIEEGKSGIAYSSFFLFGPCALSRPLGWSQDEAPASVLATSLGSWDDAYAWEPRLLHA